MKFKIFKIFIFAFLLILISKNDAYANAPEVVGRVVTSTGAPVSGVWVKWKANPGYYRFARTDNNGNYIYRGWDDLGGTERRRQYNTRIDTNLDGTNDDYEAYYGGDNTQNDYNQHNFSCGDVPHTYSVVLPVNMNGRFTEATNIKINNGSHTEVIEDIIYTSSTPPATPMPTPTGLTLKRADFGIVPISGISGVVFVDHNINGVMDPGEPGFTGGAKIVVTGASYAIATSDGGGNYSFPSIPSGTYGVWAEIPFNYSSTSPNNRTVTIPPGSRVNFGVISTYTVTGNIFNDVNKNIRMDSGETTVPGSVITSTAGIVNMWDGKFEIQNLKSGIHTITYSSVLPRGFQYLYPIPSSFTVTVGGACSVDNRTGASCNGGNIENLNYAVSDSWPWVQTYGLDVRFDNGIKNLLPASTACGSGSYASGTVSSFNSPGIIFTGDSSPDFGQGQASSSNRVVGGIAYPEVFNGKAPLKTSVRNLLASADKAGVTKISLDSRSSCRNPSSSCNLQGFQKGFYYTSGDLRIDSSANFNNGNYVIVAEGSITIANNAVLSVTSGSTLFVAAGRDVIVDSTVGSSSKICPVPAGQIQGMYSADRHIIIEGNNGDCTLSPDKMLNIDGALIVNAGSTGGRFQNKRDLCADNRAYPSLTVKSRPDFILNIPGFMTQQQNIVNEETP